MAMQEGPASRTAAVQKSTESYSCAGYLATEIPSVCHLLLHGPQKQREVCLVP